MSASGRGAAGSRPVPRRLLPNSRLARLAADGDAPAFEEIFRRHHQELYRYCRAILSDPDDAQDALQNTMAAALRALPGEPREISLRPWLFRVAHNEAISIARRRSDSAPVLETDVVAPSAAADAQERERLRSLVADLNALPERQRGALVMRELSDLSYAEIAAALSTSEGAARQIVYEAREAMREATLGREMDCAEIRKAMSTRDGRVLRGRRIRAHLRTCEPCTDHFVAISRRRADLQALAPPLPALAASGLLAGVLGEAGRSGLTAGLGSAGAGSGGAGALAGVGGAAGASAVAKGSAVIAALVVGAAAAAVSGTVDLPVLGGGDGPVAAPVEATPAAEPGQARGAGSAANGPSDSAASAGEGRRNGNANGHRRGNGRSAGRGGGHSSSNSQAGQHGQGVPAGGSDGVTGPPEQAQGYGPPASAGTGTGNAGGNSSSSQGVAASPPRSDSGAAHSNAGNGGPPDRANGQ